MMGCKGLEDKTEQAGQSIRARDRFLKKYMNGTCKNLGTHHKVINITNHGHGRRRRLSSQRWSYFTEENNHGRKNVFKSREREADPDSRGTRNTKQTRLEKGLPVSNHTLRMWRTREVHGKLPRRRTRPAGKTRPSEQLLAFQSKPYMHRRLSVRYFKIWMIAIANPADCNLQNYLCNWRW